MKILLLGKGGQVGWELQRSLAPLGELVALDFDSTEHCGDFANPEGVRETVRALRPDVIVNAAAHTAVDKAESESDFARTLNATTPGAVAQAAQELGAPSRNCSPIRKAWAKPSGLGCTAYCSFSPHWLPSPSSCSKRGVSCGVLMIKISRTPANISVLSG